MTAAMMRWVCACHNEFPQPASISRQSSRIKPVRKMQTPARATRPEPIRAEEWRPSERQSPTAKEDAREIRPDLIRDPRARSRGRTEIAGRIVDETEFARLRGRPYQRSDGECGSGKDPADRRNCAGLLGGRHLTSIFSKTGSLVAMSSRRWLLGREALAGSPDLPGGTPLSRGPKSS